MSIIRIGVSIPKEVFRELENLMQMLGLDNRSRVITDAILSYVSEKKWLLAKGVVAGSITLIYDHERGHIVKRIIHIQHQYRNVIKSTTHIHLTDRYCLEIMHIVGEVSEVRKMVTELRSVTGLYGMSMSLFPVDQLYERET